MTGPIDSLQNAKSLIPNRKNRSIEKAAAMGLNSERYGNGKSPRGAASKPESGDSLLAKSSLDEPKSGEQAHEDTLDPPESKDDGSIDYLA